MSRLGLKLFDNACKECGIAFKSKGKHKIYCTKECQVIFHRRKTTENHEKKTLEKYGELNKPRTCLGCGKEFNVDLKYRTQRERQTCSQECKYKLASATNKAHIEKRINPERAKQLPAMKTLPIPRLGTYEEELYGK